MHLSNGRFLITFFLGYIMLAQSTDNSYMPGINFSKYHTYRWAMIEGRQHPDPTKDGEIRKLIDSQLAAKGLAMADKTADLNVDYQVALSKRVTWKRANEFELWDIPKREQVIIQVGTLVLDMYDPATKKLVWTGRASKTIDPKGSDEQMRKNVERATQALLIHFPPN